MIMKKCLKLLKNLIVVLLLYCITSCLIPDDTSIFEQDEWWLPKMSGTIEFNFSDPEDPGETDPDLDFDNNNDPKTKPIGTPLTVNYSGNEQVQIEYQWERRDLAVSSPIQNVARSIFQNATENEFVPIPGETGNTYTPTEDGQYRVQVRLEGYRKAVSDPVTIKLYSLKGEIEILPPKVDETGAVIIETLLEAKYERYDGEEENVIYQWNKDGEPIKDETESTYIPLEPGGYSVSVIRDKCYPKTSATVTVEFPILKGNILIDLNLDEDIIVNDIYTTMPLRADYTGEENVSYQWYKDSDPIPEATGKTFTPEEAGSYKVSANLDGYREKSSSVTVKAFVPVTGISININKIYIDEPAAISVAVNPAGATFNEFNEIELELSENNQNTSASVYEADEGYILTATDHGDIILTATIKNGKAWGEDYEQEFTIKVATFVVLDITMEDFNLDDKGAVFNSHEPVILSSANQTVTLNISGQGLTNISWYLGNIPLATGTEFTLNYAAFNPGKYTLTIFFTKDGKRWSGDFTFNVIKEN